MSLPKGYRHLYLPNFLRWWKEQGNGNDEQGSITAFFTVLTEGDDLQDPIADASRAILDGHIVLSREDSRCGSLPCD